MANPKKSKNLLIYACTQLCRVAVATLVHSLYERRANTSMVAVSLLSMSTMHSTSSYVLL